MNDLTNLATLEDIALQLAKNQETIANMKTPKRQNSYYKNHKTKTYKIKGKSYKEDSSDYHGGTKFHLDVVYGGIGKSAFPKKKSRKNLVVLLEDLENMESSSEDFYYL